LTGAALHTATTAVVGICAQDTTGPATIAATARTFTSTALAGFATSTDFSTGTTVIGIAGDGFAGTRTTHLTGTAGLATGTAVFVVCQDIDAASVAIGLARRTTAELTNTCGTNLRGFAEFATGSAVVSVCKTINTLATAKGLTCGTNALVRVAGLTSGTFHATFATIQPIGAQVHTSAVASNLTRRTAQLTNTARTEFSGFAGISATATVCAICHAVHTKPATRRFSRGTGAFSRLTGIAARAGGSTLATVCNVSVGIDTKTVADRLPDRTGDDALSSRADFTGLADVPTSTAVLQIRLQVATDTRTIGLARKTGAFAALTGLATGAAGSTSATVVVVEGCVRAGAIAIDLPDRTGKDTLAVDAELPGETGFFAGSTMGTVGACINTNSSTIELSGRTDTFASRTEFAASTLCPTGTTMVVAGLSIDTGISTGFLTCGTIESTFAGGADLASGTLDPAASAVGAVCRGVDTDTFAIGLTREADTFA
jgi:hypothetical protein